MKPSEALERHRDAIRRIVEDNNALNPRVFGSVIHGDDTEDSDLDIFVDEIDGRTTLPGQNPDCHPDPHRHQGRCVDAA